MIFILNMARREMRASWRRLILFFLCIAIGVAAMVSVHSFTDHLAVSMTRHARGLMSADVRVETNRPWPADGSALLRRMTSSSRVTDYTEVIETETMARLVNAADSRPVMIQVRGVRDRFPLHGEVRLGSGAVYSHALLDNRGAMVSPALLTRLGVKVGDSIAIGSHTFEIRAAADRVPGGLMNFNPMPRVIVYQLDLSALSADMFFIDIQNDQRDAAETALASLGARDVRLAPVVRLRMVGSKWGPNHDPNDRQDVAAKRIGGEQRVSYRQALDPSETIVAGQFWDGSPSAEPEISLEEGQATWWNLEVGDTLFFEILGRRIEARVTSLRRLERRVRSMSPLTQFNVLFRPGVLESAPHTYLGALKGPPPGDERARLQNAFVDGFPNVTLVDALDEIQEVRNRIADLSVALTTLGGFVSGCGALILIGSIAVTRYQRVYEAAILKTIGARKSVLVRTTLIEYGVLGLVAGCIGSAASIVLIWAMSATGALQIPWRLHPAVNIVGILLTVLLVMVVGVVSTWNVLTSKPIGTLREQ